MPRSRQKGDTPDRGDRCWHGKYTAAVGERHPRFHGGASPSTGTSVDDRARTRGKSPSSRNASALCCAMPDDGDHTTTQAIPGIDTLALVMTSWAHRRREDNDRVDAPRGRADRGEDKRGGTKDPHQAEGL